MRVDWDRMADRLLPGLWVAEKMQKRGSPVAWGPGGGLGLFGSEVPLLL